MKEKITRSRAKELINGVGGKIFTAIFVKRTNGELRVMNCRKGVKKGTKGGSLPYNPNEKELVPVYDVQKALELKREGKSEEGAFRMISLDKLKELHIGKEEYEVV